MRSRNVGRAEHLVNLAAMVDLVEKQMCEDDVHRIRAARAFSVRPFDRPCQPIRIRRVTEFDDAAIGFHLRHRERLEVGVQHRIVREHWFGERARELAEVPAVDEEDMVQGPEDRTEESASVLGTFRRR